MARRAGAIRERRPGVWQVSVEAKPHPITGRRARRSKYVKGTRRDAERALALLTAEVVEGNLTVAGTFAALLDDWWATMSAHRWEHATALRHRQDVVAYLEPALGRRRLTDLEPADFDRLYARMTRDGKAPRTIQHVHGTARAALNHAVRQGLIARNPAASAVVPVRKRVNRELPPVERLERVVELAGERSLLWASWFRVAFWTGARPAEVCALRWADVDLDRGEITYRAAIGRHVEAAPGSVFDGVSSGWAPKGTKTNTAHDSGVRTVAIDLATQAALRRWRVEFAGQLLEVGLLVEPDLFVFPSDVYGLRPLTPATPSRRWRRYAEAAGVDPSVRLYDAARHRHISWCLAMGFPVADVAHRVGNSPETIFRTYAHLLVSRSRDIADAIDQSTPQRREGGLP